MEHNIIQRRIVGGEKPLLVCLVDTLSSVDTEKHNLENQSVT
jgi:hypothetical protein